VGKGSQKRVHACTRKNGRGSWGQGDISTKKAARRSSYGTVSYEKANNTIVEVDFSNIILASQRLIRETPQVQNQCNYIGREVTGTLKKALTELI